MRVSFVGLGTMGAPMAERVHAAGHDLSVCDVREEAAASLVTAGARFSPKPAEAVRNAEVVLLSLPGPPEVRSRGFGADGIADAVGPGATVGDLSTNSRQVVREVHEHFVARGVG